MKFLCDGFMSGFDLGYRGPFKRRDTSRNIPIRPEVGNEQMLWDNMLKEVGHKRFVGPFEKIHYNYFVQSPVSLVPKAGNQARLIFHLSYDFDRFKSINHYIPREWCTVKYNDLDHAIRTCLRLLELDPEAVLWFGISDLKCPFHLVPLSPKFWPLLTMWVRNAVTKEWNYFIDKCLPFGASISCTIFQRFSNALAHIHKFRLKHMVHKGITNYLDDFLNIALSQVKCNIMLENFHRLCKWL